MKVIHKFDAPYLNSRKTINLSPCYEILSVGLDPNKKLCLWIILDPSEIPTIVEFENYGSGCPMDESKERKFIGTVVEGNLTHHIFKVN